MKLGMTLLATGLIMLGAWGGAVSAQDSQRFVRYVRGADVSWGELVGETIFELSDAPYLGGERTGESTALSAAELRAPVEPLQIFMTAFNFRSHISGEPAEYPGLFLVPPSSIIDLGRSTRKLE